MHGYGLSPVLERGDWNLSVTDTALTVANGVESAVMPPREHQRRQGIRYDNFRVVNPQTFTVTRSVNNITKSHTAGTDVRLAYPAITRAVEGS